MVDCITQAWQVTSTKKNILSAWETLPINYTAIAEAAKNPTNNDVAVINSTSMELVLAGPKSGGIIPMSAQRKVGVHINSRQAVATFMFTEAKKKRGRPPKNVTNNLVLIQNNQTNNIVQNNLIVAPGATVPATSPGQDMLPPPSSTIKPKRKYTKRAKSDTLQITRAAKITQLE
ncbi:hypothetical protein SAMD00019534_037640 [Acytostelium subglobosum LB1]|uniref:hypothetical protein n=1 Tax=Acytostelium subglobosum LB1 TaxID=1410327 RepID=UPI000644ED69|nr:hypothetical protein SAMD00019534_037640 [Acytostelium subglobosum LB1]GAM20589.1 hypothetical protein SAMD00019534_037640 [Acytostelium subglobosum LB1]|eukprot:XP_012760110.1 hypothetical protein SAMD00019534_037640 [Acytostelium subglobosum LB1]